MSTIEVGSVWLPSRNGRGGPFVVIEVSPEIVRYTFRAIGGFPGMTERDHGVAYTASNALRRETFLDLMTPTTVDSPEYLERAKPW